MDKLIYGNPIGKRLVNVGKSKTCQHVLSVGENVMKRSWQRYRQRPHHEVGDGVVGVFEVSNTFVANPL